MQPARISDCQLVNWELGVEDVESLVELMFNDLEERYGDKGSAYQNWFRSVATGKDAVVDERSSEESVFDNSRLIAWKTDKPFKPENLFFRTVDSGRLLPMHLADFRIQIYGHKYSYEKLDASEGGRKGWAYLYLSCYMHRILVLRNMHDRGGADIPIILTVWDEERTKRALDYWTDLSKGEWSDEEQRLRFQECDAFCRHQVLPCFYQTDLLVRSLLSDPAVGYVPPFIIFHSMMPNGNTCILFTKPLHVPPPSLAHNWPTSCNGLECERADCAPLDMNLSRSLVDKSHMVREWNNVGPRRTLCNLWGCEVRYSKDSDVKLQRCQRCKEVLYCSSAHQTLDWGVHKNVCEKRR
ncbi:hypothetical protein C8F04DRAFT_1092647 [Mycena alexandri]|uniref:MYND-type domain-containing protein n=1 Tax=Mycena alexandri TaxID=1745969 RepID=A0AAD6X5M2_9AGAR|nr:hypothetical protein C8F04DRAFT_1092647 [Mycena alexandri]